MNIFEKLYKLLQGVVYLCLLLAGVACAVFLVYFVGMTLLRAGQLCWDAIFSHKWGL